MTPPHYLLAEIVKISGQALARLGEALPVDEAPPPLRWLDTADTEQNARDSQEYRWFSSGRGLVLPGLRVEVGA